MKTAFLYAGQGSQHPGMGQAFYDTFPSFRDVYDTAPAEFPLTRTALEDPDGILNETEYTQPCMVAFAVGVTALLRDAGIRPNYVAGLSLGEYSALSCAGVFSGETAIALAAFRGRAMAEAVRGLDSAMIAVLGLDEATVRTCCQEASRLGIAEISNLNCPGQIVVGGERVAVEEAVRLCREQGAKRCMPLKVSGPFHTSLLKPAGDALREKFQTLEFGEMKVPVLFNCLGDVMGPTDSIPALLEQQVSHAVRMEDTIRRLADYGVDMVVEIGPGKVLSGFVRKTCPHIKCYPVETPSDLERVREAVS